MVFVMLETVTLRRTEYRDDGVFGRLEYRGKEIACTCEDPDNGNAEGKSCIPKGRYEVGPHNTPKYPDVWEVLNVPHRSAILIHNGNTNRDTQGCILVGRAFAMFAFGDQKIKGVTYSKLTLASLKTLLPKRFTLDIIDDLAG